jgi:NAD(P)-dependent dehydrogenase (short-subunit alcohol dehydrogenase family)
MSKQIIFVVGSSRGIGKALVDLLAQNPHNEIYALSRNVEESERHFSKWTNVHSYAFDLEEDVRGQLVRIIEKVERIDVLINNAGLLINKPFPELSAFDFNRSFQVNTIGVMETVQALLPKMLTFGGHIVNISSMGGFQGTMKFAGLTAYSSSKAALINFTELFAEEYKNTSIKMNCLALGAAQTEMLQEAFPGYQAPVSAEKMAEFIAEFSLNGANWFNGKIIPVALTTP